MGITFEKQEQRGTVFREPTIPEILRYRRSDAEFLGFIQRPGWTGELPYYRFKCQIHGRVENYPHGFDHSLECPHCQERSQ